MSAIMTFVTVVICLTGVFVVGIAWGQYRTRTRLLRLIGKIQNDMYSIKYSATGRSLILYILDKFEEEEKKWNW